MIRVVRVARPVGAALLVALLLVPAASAAKVRWNETAKDGKKPVMSFRVESFTFGSKSWSARVTMKNLSKKTITIGNRFGAAIYQDGHTTDLNQMIGFADAMTFTPARPKKLAPGAAWTGTISGTGTLKPSTRQRYARVVFGPLGGLPGQSGPVYWITDHRLALQPTGGGLAI